MGKYPDSLIEKYYDSDYELIPIQLPPPTSACINSLVTAEERCSDDYSVQVGSIEGACDVGAQKYVTLSHVAQCNDEKDDLCSPAYEAIKNYKLSELSIQQFFKYRDEDPNRDMRSAVCRWFNENLDNIKANVVPNTYPRQPIDTIFYQPIVIGSIATASFAVLCVIITGIAIHLFKKTRAMVSANCVAHNI